MAEGGADVILNIAGNTRQLERDIQKIANTGISLNTKGFSQPLGKITGQLGEFEKSFAAIHVKRIRMCLTNFTAPKKLNLNWYHKAIWRNACALLALA